MSTNGNVTPIRPVNWADTAKPFMASLVTNLKETLTVDEVKERLAKNGTTPKDFLVNSLLNVLGAVTNQNWALGLFADKVRADAMSRADDLAALYGGYDEAIAGLIKQDLTTLETGLK